MNNEKGFTTVIILFLILIMFALTGLIIDGGYAMMSKTKLDHATEVAVKEAILHSYDTDIYNSQGIYVLEEEVLKRNIIDCLALNMDKAFLKTAIIKPEELNSVYVTTEITIDTFFMKIFGKNEIRLTSNVEGFIYD